MTLKTLHRDPSVQDQVHLSLTRGTPTTDVIDVRKVELEGLGDRQQRTTT